MKFKKLLLVFIVLVLSPEVHSQTLDTLLEMGNYKLHFKIIKGRGTPILFEEGGGNDLSQLDTLLAPLFKATSATLITYDRQGFGQSGLDTADYTILNEIKGLELGLKKMGYENSPFILVCHSLGAFYAQVYASRHPKLIEGIVMLDPRIASSADMLVAKKTFNTLDREQLKKESISGYYVLSHMEKNSDYVRHCSLPLTIPILDIMAENGPYTSVVENEAFKERQRKFMKRYNSNIYFIKGSEHNLPQDKPDVVVKKVVEFYNLHK